jgi:hypothetical protein
MAIRIVSFGLKHNHPPTLDPRGYPDRRAILWAAERLRIGCAPEPARDRSGHTRSDRGIQPIRPRAPGSRLSVAPNAGHPVRGVLRRPTSVCRNGRTSLKAPEDARVRLPGPTPRPPPYRLVYGRPDTRLSTRQGKQAMKPLLVVWGLTCAGDPITTHHILTHGGREAWLPTQSPVLATSISAGTCVAGLVSIAHLAKDHPKGRQDRGLDTGRTARIGSPVEHPSDSSARGGTVDQSIWKRLVPNSTLGPSSSVLTSPA